MKFTNTFSLLLTALATADAYKLPKGTKDGLYIVDLKAKGGPKISPIPDNQTHSPPPRTHRRSRNPHRILPVASAGCQASQNSNPGVLDEAESDRAARVFKQWCDAGGKMRADSMVVSKYGSVVAYGCSVWGYENPCSSAEWDEAVGLVDDLCGEERHTGYVWMQDWAKTYGKDKKDADICVGV